VFHHITTEGGFDQSAIFSSIFITLFVYDVPHSVATRIFELFILEGEKILLSMLYKMIKIKQKKLLSLKHIDLLHYMREGMIMECIKEVPLEELIKD
jgi:hypothetical protein